MNTITNTFFRFLLFAIIGIGTFASCKEFKEATVTDVDSVNLNKVTTEGIEADIKLKIKNPNNIGFSIYPSEFDVLLSGIKLGKAKLNKRVHIDANSERVYSFILKSNLSDLNPLEIMKLLNIDNAGKIEIKGDLKAGKFYLKKKFNVNYTDKVNILK